MQDTDHVKYANPKTEDFAENEIVKLYMFKGVFIGQYTAERRKLHLSTNSEIIQVSKATLEQKQEWYENDRDLLLLSTTRHI